jgi:DNA invertase Pin-like site-specific DNA recombinase
MKTAIYCRVSTDDQNIDQQRALLVEYCNKNNHIFRSYMDEAVSGKIEDRPQWQKLIADCERGEFEAILVVKADRITRTLKYALWFYDWLQAHKNVRLISLYDSINFDTPDGYFVFMLNCLLSERELLVNQWRMRIGIERAKKEGKYKGRAPGSKNSQKFTRTRI